MTKNRFIKAALSAITASVLLFVTYCGTDSGSDDDSVPVSITFSIPSAKMKASRVLNKPVPSIVKSIFINISAADITTISDTFNVSAGTIVTRSYSIDPGTERTFSAYAYDGVSGSGLLLYQGTSIDDLTAGVSASVVINMAHLGQFVDVNSGDDISGDGSPANPYKTITFALSTSTGNEPINVAAGFYNITTGETFPLELKTGTALTCYGNGYTTVIDATDSFSYTILGAAGTTIEGCNVVASESAIAISDEGKQITINDNIIEAVPGTYDNSGIYLTADSTVSNSVIRFFSRGEGGGEGIMVDGSSPSISGSTIISNEYGIYAFGNSNPTISFNTITSNLVGIVSFGNSVITNNTITGNNDYGIEVAFGAATTLINDNILSCNSKYDIQYNSTSDVDAKNNRWDHSPPTWWDSACSFGTDICDNGGFINYTGYTLAPSPCP